MRIIIFILYNLFLYPLFLLIIFFLSLFNSKIRRGVRGRFETKSILIKYFNQNFSNDNIYWFHASSYGEYLQAEPVIDGIKKIEKNSIILLSFFSPSGYDNVNNQNINCKVYMPFDFYWTIQNVLSLVKPKKIIFATTDLWINLIWLANYNKIDTILIGAKSKDYFNNSLSIMSYFYKPIYKSLTKIFTVNNTDYLDIDKYLGDSTNIVYQVGNPRFDQVISASENIKVIDKQLIQDRKNIIMFASMHNQDRNVVLPKTIRYMEQNRNIQIIWIPHEPNDQDNRYIESIFKMSEISVKIINSIEDFDIDSSRVQIINLVGVLSKMYWKVKIAFIGGGFSTGVHNLMEPSVAGVPTIFGPKYHEFDEASEIINNKSGFSIKKGTEFIEILDQFINNDQKLILASQAAQELVNNNAGASNKIVREILSN